MAWSRSFTALLAASALALSGCTSLLGDFKYDPNPAPPAATGGSSNGPTPDQQGDIVVVPATGLVTTELGGKAFFTISLKRKPTANVAIALSSSNEKEGVVNPISVSFTPVNYDAPQTVQITGVDDTAADTTQSYTIRTTPATTDDPTYLGLDPLDPQVVNVDDETAGFTEIGTTGLTTTESGGEATFGVVLNHAPLSDVVIAVSSDRETEGTVSPKSLTFTSLNWMAPQMVTVTGVNDDAADKAQVFHVLMSPATSSDPAYNQLKPLDVAVTNQDNDTAGVTLTPATGLITFENGAMTTFGIALNSPPSKDVTIALKSNDEAEGIATPASVTFTALNWNAPQTVTVTGQDDTRVDGSQPYKVVTGVAVTDDPGYQGVDGPDAELLNIDDDSAGLVVMGVPATGLVTTEEGGSSTFTVALQSKPNGDVLLDVASSRITEGTVLPAALTFTEFNWNAPQTVTVTGINDLMADGMQTYAIHITPNAMTGDVNYATLFGVDVSCSNADNDSAGIMVVAASGLTTTEAGGSATFTVVLNSQPSGDVTIPLTSSDATEGTVSPAKLVFTSANYNAPQTVTVKGVNDDMQDGMQPYRINTEPAQSTDAGYKDMNAANVDLTNTDDDSAGITVNPMNQTLVTTEGGGTATFTVVLNSQPNAEVRIPVSSSNLAEGTVNTTALTFTMDNWRAPQTVTVKGVDDDSTADGDQQYRVTLGAAVSGDKNYVGKDPPDVKVSNIDNDSPGISLRNANALQTKEDGSMATFQVVLNSKPTASVVIDLSSSRPGEGSVTPASLTFTGANWAAPQTVTVTGVDDNVADGNQPYRAITKAAVSADPKYLGRDAADANVTNVDNDSPGIGVVFPAGGIVTKEATGGTATFTIQLNSQPTADVTVPVHSRDLSEGTVAPASVTFTAGNWNAPRTITVTGVEDAMADGPQPYTIEVDPAQSQDPKYAGYDALDVPATNIDNDSAGITVSPISGDTKEPTGSASFTVVLNSQPSADVSIAVSSDDLSEGVVSPALLTFNSVNWAAPQKVTVTGVDDPVADGPQPYRIILAPATSNDLGYRNRDADDVMLSNIDNDSADITVSPIKGKTSELGGTATFTIVLNSQPTGDVTIPLSSGNPNEGKLAVSGVTFSTADYASPRTITVTGVDDFVADGDQPYSIVIGAASSTDKGYDKRDALDVQVINVDDDSAGLMVSATQGTTGEKLVGGSFAFTIALTSKPATNVSVPLTSTDPGEGKVSPATLVFSTDNWKSPQTVTVTGVDDDEADGAQPYLIQIGAATSEDPGYSGFDYPVDVAMSNTDDDSAGFEVSPATGTTSEKGATASFTIVLLSKPTGSVTIPLSSSKVTEGRISETSVTFTPDKWNVVQTIVVHGNDDKVADGPQPYSIVTGQTSSTDKDYDDKNPEDVDLVNLDDDKADIIVSDASGPTSEAGDTATFSIVLNSQPTGTVSIPVKSSNIAEGTLDVTSVDFTVDNWFKPQDVTVTGVDDLEKVADGAQSYTILVGMPTSTDTKYAAIDPDDVAMVNTDDDSASFKITAPAMNKTYETAGSADVTFSVVLTSKPKATVTLPLTSSNEAEGVISDPVAGQLVFTGTTWNEPQFVTITGVDDADVDTDQAYSIQIGPPESTDSKYDMLGFQTVNLVNVDDDVPPPIPDP